MAKVLHMPIQTGKIGVFDSGVGGLTVLREIMAHLPSESLLYFGDTARVPYGDRTQAELLRFVREIITWMQGQGVKMVVMACNTSSALALEQVRSEFDMPILGVILPGARTAAQQGDPSPVISIRFTDQSKSLMDRDRTAKSLRQFPASSRRCPRQKDHQGCAASR